MLVKIPNLTIFCGERPNLRFGNSTHVKTLQIFDLASVDGSGGSTLCTALPLQNGDLGNFSVALVK